MEKPTTIRVKGIKDLGCTYFKIYVVKKESGYTINFLHEKDAIDYCERWKDAIYTQHLVFT